MTEITQIDIRKIRCLDGLHYSFRILEKHYNNLYKTCCEIPNEPSALIDSLIFAWGFVDALHRINQIAQSVPSLSSKHPEMRAFLDGTGLAKEYRHYIQHLRRELAKNPPNKFPVWGSLSWVDPHNATRCHTAIFGASIQDIGYSSCVYDRLENKWVSNVCLAIENKSFNFDPIFESCMRLKEFILPFLNKDAVKEVEFHNKVTIFSLDIISPTAKNIGSQ